MEEACAVWELVTEAGEEYAPEPGLGVEGDAQELGLGSVERSPMMEEVQHVRGEAAGVELGAGTIGSIPTMAVAAAAAVVVEHRDSIPFARVGIVAVAVAAAAAAAAVDRAQVAGLGPVGSAAPVLLGSAALELAGSVVPAVGTGLGSTVAATSGLVAAAAVRAVGIYSVADNIEDMALAAVEAAVHSNCGPFQTMARETTTKFKSGFSACHHTT